MVLINVKCDVRFIRLLSLPQDKCITATRIAEGCHDKLQQIEWLSTTEIYLLTSPEAKGLK